TEARATRLAQESERLTRERPSWPQTWMNVAQLIARRSYDPRLRVGCIIVSEDNTQVLAVGYNGNFKGGPHRYESVEPGQTSFIHAEANALVKCDYNTVKGQHMYVTHSPCRMCSKLLVNSGVTRVVYGELYRDPSGLD